MSLLLNAHRMLEVMCKPRETACSLLIPYKCCYSRGSDTQPPE